MRVLGKILKWLAILAVLAVVGVAGWLAFAPPALIRVATAYSAKIVCSNQFLAWRDGQEVLALDVQAPGHPILKYISVDVDALERTVSARLLGLFGEGRAVHRPGVGCASVPGGAEAQAMPPLPEPGQPHMAALWPAGERVEPSQDAALAAILDDPAMTGPGMRAVVVAQGGRIVGERYGEGFKADTPLLGWSMTKTVTAAIVGTLVREGRLSLDQDGLFEGWNGDERGDITLADLMAMSSGLEFNEDYGDVTDVTRMLYLEADMAGFAADKPLAGPRGEAFSYSSGTTVMLSRIWQDAFADPAHALAWPREALFGPLGMTSAVLEADAGGTFVGSSYLYATARDWARFGEFLRNDGVWAGRQVLPEGFASWMREEAPASDGEYGRGQLWLRGPGEGGDAGFDLPDDAFWLLGHDGQSTAVIPSRGLVVVRLGLTPSRLGYKPQKMVEALARLYGGAPAQ
ncbi:MAG: 6-aminohexanoate hydrolase [Hyphomicrobiales bacterium]|nr:MAG: 6-aminohexanoate hydrolase [Hyphomicrobiales bacterium]